MWANGLDFILVDFILAIEDPGVLWGTLFFEVRHPSQWFGFHLSNGGSEGAVECGIRAVKYVFNEF